MCIAISGQDMLYCCSVAVCQLLVSPSYLVRLGFVVYSSRLRRLLVSASVGRRSRDEADSKPTRGSLESGKNETSTIEQNSTMKKAPAARINVRAAGALIGNIIESPSICSKLSSRARSQQPISLNALRQFNIFKSRNCFGWVCR